MVHRDFLPKAVFFFFFRVMETFASFERQTKLSVFFLAQAQAGALPYWRPHLSLPPCLTPFFFLLP